MEKEVYKNVERLYRKRALIYNIMSESAGRRRSFRKFFLRKNYLKKSSRILDAGCGTGIVIQSLIKTSSKKDVHNTEFYGFDLTSAIIEIFNKWIKKQGYKNIHLYRANVLKIDKQLPNSWTNFDLIVSANLLEHIPRDKLPQAIKKLKSLLMENGKLVLFIEKDNIINRTFVKLVWGSEVYTKEQLSNIFKKAGFKHIKINKFGSFFFRCFVVEAKN